VWCAVCVSASYEATDDNLLISVLHWSNMSFHSVLMSQARSSNASLLHSFCIYHCLLTPFPSNRHHRSNGDCLKGKRGNYQVCSVQYCVQQLYTMYKNESKHSEMGPVRQNPIQRTVSSVHMSVQLHTHMNRTNSSLDWVLSHWAHFTVLRFIFVYVLFCV